MISIRPILLFFFVSGVMLDQVSVIVPGDIILGGLFPIHEKGDDHTPCGLHIYHRGIQRLEAMMFAIDLLNKDENILPNVTLGVHILDTCSRDTYALNQSLQFVRASMNNIDASTLECADKSTPRPINNLSGPLFGVVGGSYSSVSLQVANLLGLFHIPQVSPASTAKALSDKTRFEFFARTVPPDTFQSSALVDIIKIVNWSYITTIFSEGSYGEHGIEVFHREARERNVCIAAAEKIPSSADDKVFESIVLRISKKTNAKAIILFTRAEDARGILQAAKRLNMTDKFYWVASDGWGKQLKLVEGLEDVALGAITVELKSTRIPEFDKYMMSLTPENNVRNPWFEQYWEDTFNCVLPKNVPLTTDKKIKVCDENLRLSSENGYEQESKVQFVVDAVFAFGNALNKLYHDVCKGWNYKGICPAMAQYDGGDFYRNYLLNVSFTDIVGSSVRFDKHGDGPARYDILNYQKLENGSGYHYKVVGSWFNSLKMDLTQVVWPTPDSKAPDSVCSLPCDLGMIKKQQGDTCCWVCLACDAWEYAVNESTCRDCGPGYWPTLDKRSCFQIEVEYMKWTSIYSLIPSAVACIGIGVTIFVVVLFLKNNNTPIVRASGRELSYMLLLGILFCYGLTFSLLAKPTYINCIAQRLGIGVGFSIIYGALLTKTNRISRIFDTAANSAIRPKYISPKSQVIITILLILVQVGITLLWMLVEPPGVRHTYPTRMQTVLSCNIQDKSFLSSQLYNMILITTCTVYAFKTRRIPENFNESKFIGFTMYTTCIIWLAFIPIYFGTGNLLTYETQVSTICIVMSLNATVALVCLFFPKVYIILFQPEKNVRKLTMNSAANRRYHTTICNAPPQSARGHVLDFEDIPLQVITTVGPSNAPPITVVGGTNSRIAETVVAL